jgi:hypothetical protein
MFSLIYDESPTTCLPISIHYDPQHSHRNHISTIHLTSHQAPRSHMIDGKRAHVSECDDEKYDGAVGPGNVSSLELGLDDRSVDSTAPEDKSCIYDLSSLEGGFNPQANPRLTHEQFGKLFELKIPVNERKEHWARARKQGGGWTP